MLRKFSLTLAGTSAALLTAVLVTPPLPPAPLAAPLWARSTPTPGCLLGCLPVGMTRAVLRPASSMRTCISRTQRRLPTGCPPS
jgi:hypothetical protein